MNQRPIKIKAWDTNKREFIRVLSLDQLENPALIPLQFTGVYDMNGREIWEGDILYWQCYGGSKSDLIEYWQEVLFWEGAFGTGIPDQDFNPFCNLNLMSDSVVGNAFENANLLTKCQV